MLKSPPDDIGREGTPLSERGTRLYGRKGTEFENVFAIGLGYKPRRYVGEAGFSLRYAFYWPDNGKIIWPCERGIVIDNDRWRIG